MFCFFINIKNTMGFSEREKELKNIANNYVLKTNSIMSGIEADYMIQQRKSKILQYFAAGNEQWEDYKWQLAHSIEDLKILKEIDGYSSLDFSNEKECVQKFRFRITPYYLSLVDYGILKSPIGKMCFPSSEEVNDFGQIDPMDEEGTTIHNVLTRRYPDRVIIKVTNSCGMFCRFCQRRRLIGEQDMIANRTDIEKAIEYVRQNKEIRDVLLTGGDVLTLSDNYLDWILNILRGIEHIEIIRIGTRAPVTFPQRITKKLVDVLKKFKPIYINVHFNHPMEITFESAKACELLVEGGIPLGNQSVLLRDINDDEFVMRKLNQELLKIRVKPYYLFHPKSVAGTKHFWVSINRGKEIMASMRGTTSGFAIPNYIFNIPGGKGKIPILPEYITDIDEHHIILKNWEGVEYEIENYWE